MQINEFVGSDEHLEYPVDLTGRDIVREQVWVSFRVVGDDFDPDEITERTGLLPRGNDKRPRQPPISWAGGKPHPPSAVWFVAVRALPDAPLDPAADRLLSALEPQADYLRGLAGARRLFEIHCVIGRIPEWLAQLEPDTLRRIAALDATLNVEFICGNCY